MNGYGPDLILNDRPKIPNTRSRTLNIKSSSSVDGGKAASESSSKITDSQGREEMLLHSSEKEMEDVEYEEKDGSSKKCPHKLFESQMTRIRMNALLSVHYSHRHIMWRHFTPTHFAEYRNRELTLNSVIIGVLKLYTNVKQNYPLLTEAQWLYDNRHMIFKVDKEKAPQTKSIDELIDGAGDPDDIIENHPSAGFLRSSWNRAMKTYLQNLQKQNLQPIFPTIYFGNANPAPTFVPSGASAQKSTAKTVEKKKETTHEGFHKSKEDNKKKVCRESAPLTSDNKTQEEPITEDMPQDKCTQQPSISSMSEIECRIRRKTDSDAASSNKSLETAQSCIVHTVATPTKEVPLAACQAHPVFKWFEPNSPDEQIVAIDLASQVSEENPVQQKPTAADAPTKPVNILKNEVIEKFNALQKMIDQRLSRVLDDIQDTSRPPLENDQQQQPLEIIGEYAKEAKSLNEDLHLLAHLIEKETQSKREASSHIRKLTGKIERRNKDIKALRDQIVGLKRNRMGMQRRLEEENDSTHDDETENLQKPRQRHRRYSNDRERSHSQKSDNDAHHEIECLRIEIKQLKEKYNEQELELARAREQNKSLEAQLLIAQEQAQIATQTVNTLQQTFSLRNIAIDSFQMQINDLMAQNNILKNILKYTREAQQQYELSSYASYLSSSALTSSSNRLLPNQDAGIEPFAAPKMSQPVAFQPKKVEELISSIEELRNTILTNTNTNSCNKKVGETAERCISLEET